MTQRWAENGGEKSEIFFLSLQNEYEKKYNRTNQPHVYEPDFFGWIQ